MPRDRRLLKIGELAARSGLPVSTIRHYINEGLLGDPEERSRNMAYYDRSSLQRIALIKSLQDELYLPLRVIKKLLVGYQELDAEDYDLILALRARLAEHHSDILPELAGVPHSVVEKLDLRDEELVALEAAGVISPRLVAGEKRYDEVDYRVLSAFSKVRESGVGQELATTEDVIFYVVALRRLAKIETRLFARRVAKDRPIEEIVELIRAALPAVNEVIGALHHKILMEELAVLEGADRPDS